MHIFSVSIQEMWYISVTFGVCDKPYVGETKDPSLPLRKWTYRWVGIIKQTLNWNFHG